MPVAAALGTAPNPIAADVRLTTRRVDASSGSNKDTLVNQTRRSLAVSAHHRAADRFKRNGQDCPASRRRHLLLSLGAAGISLLPSAGRADSGEVLRVGETETCSTIGAALAAAGDGATIRVAAGRYNERLIIDKRVSIEAAPGATVTVSWSTSQPYESTVESRGKHGAQLRGVAIRHRSPSVANNYAVFLQGSNLVLEDCSISSGTGSGIGIEGGSPLIRGCRVHDCERHGIAVFSELGGSAGGGCITGCSVTGNKLDGLLVRDGADPTVTGNVVGKNGGYGATLKGRYHDNSFTFNARGSIYVDALADVEVSSLAAENALDNPVALD